MEGDIIYVDYELSSWKYQNKNTKSLYIKYINGMITTKNTQQTNEFFRPVYKGSGSAYGGKWKPKKPGDDRYWGKPGEIKVT